MVRFGFSFWGYTCSLLRFVVEFRFLFVGLVWGAYSVSLLLVYFSDCVCLCVALFWVAPGNASLLAWGWVDVSFGFRWLVFVLSCRV